MGTPRTRPVVLAYLERHSGKNVHISELSAELSLTYTQIQTQMRNMIADGFPIRCVVKAATWIYQPVPEAAPERASTIGQFYEEIGRTKNDAPILKDETGGIWIGRSIE